jgi:hypothetical protein
MQAMSASTVGSTHVVSGRLSGFAVGGIAVHSSLLNAVLHEQPEIKT